MCGGDGLGLSHPSWAEGEGRLKESKGGEAPAQGCVTEQEHHLVASLGAMRWAQSNCLFGYLDLCTRMAMRNGTVREGLFVVAAWPVNWQSPNQCFVAVLCVGWDGSAGVAQF